MEVSGCRNSVDDGSLKFVYFVDLHKKVFLSVSFMGYESELEKCDNVSVFLLLISCYFIIYMLLLHLSFVILTWGSCLVSVIVI